MTDTTDNKTTKKRPPRKNARYIHQGINVQFWRMRKGLTQKELGIKIGKSQQQVCDIEKLEVIEEDVVKAIADALEIQPQDITDWVIDDSVNIFNIDKMGDGADSTNMVGTNNFEVKHHIHIYPLDKVCELYEKMLKDKDEKEIALKAAIMDSNKMIEELRNELKRIKENL